MNSFSDLLSPSGIALALALLVWVAGSLWYIWLCSGYVQGLCAACTEEIRQEHEASPIIVQATPEMTAAQLATLLQDAEAILQAQQAMTAQS